MMTADGTTFQVINGMLQVTFYEQKQDLNTCHLRVTAGRNVNTLKGGARHQFINHE